MHEYIAQPGASAGLAGASNTLKSNQPTANSIQRLTHRNPDTPRCKKPSSTKVSDVKAQYDLSKMKSRRNPYASKLKKALK
jgi:hypothetical protein